MDQQSFSSLKNDLNEHSNLFVRKLDSALHQSALSILQQLVHAGDGATAAWQHSARWIEPHYQCLRSEQCRTRVQKKWSGALKKTCSDLRGSHYLAKPIDAALNQSAFFVLQQLVYVGEKATLAWHEGAEWVEPHYRALTSIENTIRVQHYLGQGREAFTHAGTLLKNPNALARTVDAGFNQSAFFVLQQLVNTGDFATQAWMRGNLHMQPMYATLTRHLKRRYARLALKQFTKPDFRKMLALISDRDSSLKTIDQALQSLAYLIIESLVHFSMQSGRFLKFSSQQLVEFIRYCQRSFAWKLFKHLNQEMYLAMDTRVKRWQEALESTLQKYSIGHLPVLVRPVLYAAIITTGVISATSNADVADEMKVLIEQRKAGDAYQLGTQHPELMGDPLFDYFYGIASVETGHTTNGVLSLERVLLNDPNNDLVRLELARAYYAQGEYGRAKDEFEAVRKNQPPAGVVATINVYLDDIKAKEAQYKPTYGVYVELGMGYNNNVNAATAVNNIILPYIGPVQLGATSLPMKSAFGYDSVGANVSVPITSTVSAFANANTSAQRYSQVNGYNLNVTNATTGVKIADGPDTFKIAGFGSIAQIDQVPVPNTYGAGAEYARQLTNTDSVMVAAGSTVLQYPSQFNAYNSNLTVGTVGYRKAFPNTMWKPVIDVSANAAHQTDTSNRPDLGRRIAGASIQASFLPTDKLGITIGTGYAQSKYDANDLLYQTNRTDNLYSGNAVVQYKLTKDLAARLELTYYNNLSNLSLYGYEQWTGAVKLRYEWNSN